MKIEQVDLYQISQRLAAPFETSFGRQTNRQCLIVRACAEGICGWGECAADEKPGYSYETTGTAWHILGDFLIPALLDMEIGTPEELADRLAFVRGHPLAKAALDLAIWDMAAKMEGISLARLLTRPYAAAPRERVKVGVSIGIQPSAGETVETVAHYRQLGYGRIKLKIKPGHDVEIARALRKAYPEMLLMLDANSAYRLEDAAVLQRLDDFDLLMLEQPLGHDDIYDHSQLRALIKTPLCLDESIHSADHARYALAIGACDIINIKPGRVGGMTEARKIHDLCRANNMPVWCGGMLETGVGRAGQLALAALPGFTLPGDISATSRYYAEDIAYPEFVLNSEDSTIAVPDRAGLGVEVDVTRLESATLRKTTFRRKKPGHFI